jgi:phosphohistidine swiveling domain-containing protein
MDANEARCRAEWDQSQRERVSLGERADTLMGVSSDELMLEPRGALETLRFALEYEAAEDRAHALGYYASQWLCFECDRLLQEFLKAEGLDLEAEGLPGGLLQGLSCYSTERTRAAEALGRASHEPFVAEAFSRATLIEAIARLKDEYPQCEFLKGFSAFLKAFGLMDPGASGGQDVEAALLVIRANLPGSGRRPRSTEEALAAASRRRAEIERGLRARFSANQATLARFNKLLGWAQYWTPALDDRKWNGSMAMKRHGLFLYAGQAMVREGIIDRPEDVMMFFRSDLERYCEDVDGVRLRAVFERNKAEYERDARLVPPARLGPAARFGPVAPDPVGPEPSTISETPTCKAAKGVEGASGPFSLKGRGVTAGRATGPCCRVHSLEDRSFMDALRPGVILVCDRDTENAQWRRDWYSLLLVIGGLVMTKGEGLHHATQLTRECGVPFVVLAEEDVGRIADGAMLQMDGATGTVEALKAD